MSEPKTRAQLFASNPAGLKKAGYTAHGPLHRAGEARVITRSSTRASRRAAGVAGESKAALAETVSQRKAAAHNARGRFADQGTAAGWHAVAKGLHRGKLPRGCLLEPEHNAYPICDNDAELDCRGLHAAKQRAHINARHGVPGAAALEAEAARLLKKYCS